MQYKTILTIAIMMLMLTACGGDESAPTADTSTQNNPVPTATGEVAGNPDDVIASVNGTTITRAEFDRALARRQSDSFATDPDALASSVLETLIEQTIINLAAEDLDISVTDAQVQSEVDAMRALATENGIDWATWLSDNGYTEAEFLEASREQLITPLVRSAVIQVDSAASSEGGEQQVRARHILVNTEAEAQTILSRLQNGEDFAALAAELSRDVTTRDRGGDLGFFVAEDLTTPELASAAFAMQPGDAPQLVTTSLGFHILETMEFQNRTASPENQVIQEELQFNTWLQEQLESATIERNLN